MTEEAEKLETATEERRLELAKLVYAYQEVFNTELGKTVIMDLLTKCKAFSTPMNAIASGKHMVAMYILGMIKIPGFERLDMREK